MGFETEVPQSSPTPKLSLFSLPSKPREPPGMLTPPIQSSVSVPFQWEVAPGKPRPCAGAGAGHTPPSKPKAARCLDLPPRLLNEGKVTNTPSPTTVLDGPYSGGGGRSLFHTMSFSLSKASFRSPEEKRQIGKERWNFSSWRWGSFKENGGDGGGSLDFSSSMAGFPASVASEPKITRVRKRDRFFNSSKSHFWTSIYESVKQAVPWRRK